MEVLIPITMFISIAAIAILRPLTTRLGGLLHAMARERTPRPVEDQEFTRLRTLVEQLSGRLDLIEERLDFTERLLNSGGRTTSFLHTEPARQQLRP